MEHLTVRFVDNFSAGTRGASSAEYFLDAGYAVIFMHRYLLSWCSFDKPFFFPLISQHICYRVKSIEPFVRHVMGSKFLDMLQIDSQGDDQPSISGNLYLV